MSNNSNYLDNLVKRWDQESKVEYAEDRKYIEENIEKFKKNLSYKALSDKILLPLASLYFFLNVFKAPTLWAVIFYVLPFAATTIITYLQIKTNGSVDKIDSSLSIIEFFKHRFNVYDREIKLWVKMRYLFYPAFLTYYLAEFYFTFQTNLNWAILNIVVHLALFSFITWYYESALNELKNKREASKY